MFSKILIGDKFPKLMPSQLPESVPVMCLSLCLIIIGQLSAVEGGKIPGVALSEPTPELAQLIQESLQTCSDPELSLLPQL